MVITPNGISIDGETITADDLASTSNVTGDIQAQLDDKVDHNTYTSGLATKGDSSTVDLKAPLESPSFTGNVGIGTDSPVEALHIADSSSATNLQGIRNSTYRPHITLEDLSSNAQDRQIWADSGELFFRYGDITIDDKLDTIHMKIDSSGRVTMPYQPSFDVSCSTRSVSGIINFDTVYANVGSHYNTSNGRFTAPVNGSYYFYTSTIKNNSASVNRRYFRKNGSNFLNGRHLRLDSGQQYGDNGSLVGIIYLNAGDYVEVNHGEGTSYGSNSYDYFGGYLIG